jgi:hypothetical protein
MSKQTKRSPQGQSIMEYAFVIAFVSMLIALAFNMTKGSLFGGISGAYSSCNGAMSQMNATASNHG